MPKRNSIWSIAVLVLVLSVAVFSVSTTGSRTLERINAGATIVLAFVGLGSMAIAVVTLFGAREARIEARRPLLFPHILEQYGNVYLIIVNAGDGHAREIAIKSEPGILASVGMPLEKHFRWREPVPFLPVGGELPVDIFGREVQKVLSSPGHQLLRVTLKYQHGFTNRWYQETFPLNLDLYAYGSRLEDGRKIATFGITLQRYGWAVDHVGPPESGS